MAAGSLQKPERPDDIRLDEVFRAMDGAVHMAFGGEVHDRARAMLLEKPAQQRPVGDVALHEHVPRVAGEDARDVPEGAADARDLLGRLMDELEAENAALVASNNELRAAGQLLGDLEGENKRLRASLDYRERSAFKLLPAQIVSRDASSWWNTAKINRGFGQNVETAQPVLTADGLVGRTTTVSKEISIILLLTDENCQVAARVEGTNEQGILSGQRVAGNATPELVLNFLNRDANLQPGMKVFTAGVSGAVFPAGIPLGVIKEFRARELDGQAVVEPAADFSKLDDVFVVLGSK